MSLGGPSEQNGGEVFLFTRLFCKSWKCLHCGPRKARRYARQIAKVAVRHGLNRMMTLTLDPKKMTPGVDPVRYIQGIWCKFRGVYLGRYFDESIDYVRVLEVQQNGNPHYHVLINRFVPQHWISETWAKLGGGAVVDIRMIYDEHRISHYVTKYLTKQILLSSPAGTRRVTTSRSIRLFDRLKRPGWRLFRSGLERIFEIYRENVVAVSFHENNVLLSFAVDSNFVSI